jgi:hypothetical protein
MIEHNDKSGWQGFGSSNTSYGQFWYGNSTNFPGFLYKKKTAGGVRKTTKFAPGGNLTCNQQVYLYNKYKPGQGGVGATSTSVRRAKNRIATVCNKDNNCGSFYTYLGRYNNYTSNQNGYFTYPSAQRPGNTIQQFNSPATVTNFGVLKFQ